MQALCRRRVALLPAMVPLCLLASFVAGSRPSDSEIPPAEFLFGLCQAEGTGTIPPALSVLTYDQMVLLKETIGINSIRIFVHPTLVGLPDRKSVV